MWTVSTLQVKGPDGQPASKFRVCASSDDGGGFVEGCNHEHATVAEAEACPLAAYTISQATGSPYPAKPIEAESEAVIGSRITPIEVVSRTFPVYFAGDAEAAIAAIEAKAAEFVALLESLRTPIEECPPYAKGGVAIPAAIGIMEVEVNLAIQHAHEAEMWAMKLLRRRR